MVSIMERQKQLIFLYENVRLKKSYKRIGVGLGKKKYSVVIQPVTIYGSSPVLSKCHVARILFYNVCLTKNHLFSITSIPRRC